jgi:hypothetical protein
MPKEAPEQGLFRRFLDVAKEVVGLVIQILVLLKLLLDLLK